MEDLKCVVVKMAAAAFNVPVEEILGRGLTHSCSRARAVAARMLLINLRVSDIDIARYFNLSVHRVHQYSAQALRMMAKYSSVKTAFDQLWEDIKARNYGTSDEMWESFIAMKRENRELLVDNKALLARVKVLESTINKRFPASTRALTVGQQILQNILERSEKGYSHGRISEQFGLPQSTITNIIANGK